MVRELDYVNAARARGEGAVYMIAREILPNAAAPIIVEATIRVSFAIMLFATLSFLGLGAQPPAPEWGLMVAEARPFLFRNLWTIACPGLAIALGGDRLQSSGRRPARRAEPAHRRARGDRTMTAAGARRSAISRSAYRTRHGRARVLRNLDADDAREGEVLGLVGESGSGKSTLAFAIMHHLSGNAEIEADAVLLDGEGSVAAARRQDLPQAAGQPPDHGLSGPQHRAEPDTQDRRADHRAACAVISIWTDAAARRRAQDWLTRVALTDPDLALSKFPHEMSGGEKQRVLIAMAFACSPRLVLFDEPTTALDATTAANLLDLFAELQAETGVAALYITHDLGIVSRVATNLAVLYGGTVVEQGPGAPGFPQAATPLYRRPPGQPAVLGSGREPAAS